jgi:Domain of unknown function (DUF6089)
MRRLPLFALFILLTGFANAQTFLFNIGGGLMNYGGDLQRKVITLNQSHPFIQGGLGVGINSHWATYFSLAAGKVSASDTKFPITTKGYFRNLSFYSNMSEVSLTLEYNLFDISGMKNFTPYGFAGIGALRFKPYTYDTGNNKVYLQPLGTEGEGIPQLSDKPLYNQLSFEIPFGVGIKYAISPMIIIGGEFGFRKLFTDYVDDVSSFNYVDTAVLRSVRGPQAADLSFRADEIAGSHYQITNQRGNPDKKDTYYTFQLKLIISLGKGVFLY